MCILISLFLEMTRPDGTELECWSVMERDVCERGRERERGRKGKRKRLVKKYL